MHAAQQQQQQYRLRKPARTEAQHASSTAVTVVVFLLLLMISSESCSPARSRQTADALIADVLADARSLQDSVFGFWACHGLDSRKYGGFHGTLLRDGTPTAPTSKGLVQMTRHVWAFSTFHEHGYKHATARAAATCSKHANDAAAHHWQEPDTSAAVTTQATLSRLPASASYSTQRTSNCTDCTRTQANEVLHRQILPSSKELADAAFDFVANHMRDTDGLFVWSVSQDGKTVLQPNKVLYGQWFALYGFSQYAAVFGNPRAEHYALACFKAIDSAWHNHSTGGYTELVSNDFPSDDAAATPARDTVLPRTLNVMMHGIESLTALHRVTGDPTVLQRLVEYVTIICTKLSTQQGLIFEAYIPGVKPTDTWQAAPGTFVNYGHNLESTWLIADTMDYLLALGAVSSTTADHYRASVMRIGAAAVRDGYDAAHGGVYESGSATAGPQSTVKVWWIQAEAVLALWKLYKYFDDVTYLQKLQQTARFLHLYISDGTYSEQYWQVTADGTYKQAKDPAQGQKGNKWKASYHSSRAALFLERWLRTRVY